MQCDQMTPKNKQSGSYCNKADRAKPLSSAVHQFADSKFELTDHCQLHTNAVMQYIT